MLLSPQSLNFFLFLLFWASVDYLRLLSTILINIAWDNIMNLYQTRPDQTIIAI